jgi:hypothetical protein
VKRSGPLKRKTPLRSRTPLRARTPLRSRKPLRSNTGAHARSAGRSRRPRTGRRATKRKLDRLFSLRIRKRDRRCLRCGTRERLQCSHIVSRAADRVRWDDRNALTLCARCHMALTYHPAEKALFEVSIVGEEVYWSLHREGVDYSYKVDLEAVLDRLTTTKPVPIVRRRVDRIK